MWNIQGVHVESTWSPHGIYGIYKESTRSPGGVQVEYMEYTRSLEGVHMESTWSPQLPVGECNLQKFTGLLIQGRSPGAIFASPMTRNRPHSIFIESEM
jgi:hypothetical protein